MATESSNSPRAEGEAAELKIFLLPNLLTAGNLFCGFLALTLIVGADINNPGAFGPTIRNAILFIILACVFDLLDGRVARFNCLAAAGSGGGRDFLGFPIPAAAGTVASITLFLLWLDDRGWLDERFAKTPWRYVLPVIMVFLSFMMVSEVKYPSFKSLDWRAKRTFPKMVAIILAAAFLFIARQQILPVVLPLIFTAYLIYGFIRPRLSRKIVHEIEEEDEEEEPTA